MFVRNYGNCHATCMKYDYDLIIIGGGSAGLSLASISARLGVKVALIDAQELGGDCLHYGCVPSKTLIHSAKVAHTVRNAAKYGIKAQEPEVNWNDITARIQQVITTITNHVDNADRFRAMGCDVFTNTYATFVDTHTVSLGKTTITGKKIAICAGTRPRVIELEGLDTITYLTNETIFTLPAQPKSLLILGAGPIGAEMAQAFARLGTQVTIVNKHNTLLQHEDDDVQDFVKNTFLAEGINLQLGWNPVKVATENSQIALTIERDGKTKVVQAEQLLIAAGRTSNADKLNVSAAGIQLDKRGFIQTNEKLQSTTKNIYAAGDISGNLQFTHSASHEAGVVMVNALLPIISATIDLDAIPWTTFLDPEIASCGVNEQRAIKQNIEYTATKMPFAHQDRALAEGETEGFIKVLTNKKGVVIGCQIVGPHAGELIHEWIIARNKGFKLSSISRMTHVYPTLAGISQQVAGKYSGTAFFNPRVRTILRFLMGYRNTKIESFSD